MSTLQPQLPMVEYELSFDEDLMTPWEVRRVAINEAINDCFDAAIEIATVVDVDLDALLGASASLTLTRGHAPHEPRRLFGIVEQIEELGGGDYEHHFRLIVVPAFALLRQRINSRIWQDCSVLDIVAEVLDASLGEYGRSHERGAVARGQRVRDYCVQYRESDRDFVCRLLEEEGISYAFTHDPDRGHEVLHLYDANEQYPAFVSIVDDDTLPIIVHNPEEADIESVQAIVWARALTSTGALRRDFDWREPEQLLTSEANERDDRSRTRRIFTHMDRRFIADDLAERASDLEHASALGGAVCRGYGNATSLRPGVRFRLSGHERHEVDRVYIVTSVHHCGDSEGSQYRNEFECVPDDRDLRPLQRTPKPRIFGPQTAIVTGEDEIHTDAHGRVQVQFHWQEHPSYAADSSCWIRCAQSWSGAGWGAHFIPRVGMEVVVEFLEGNPDDPLITGCVYDGTRTHPFDLPETKTRSGWRTRSSPNGEGFNELRFEDAAGREEIYIHGQRDWRIEIENDKRQTIGRDESRSVGVNQTTTIGNNRSASVSNSDSVSVGASQSVSVGGGRSVSVGGGQSVSTGGSYSLSSGAEVSISGATKGSITMADELLIECGIASIRLKSSGEIEVSASSIKVAGESLGVAMLGEILSSSGADTVILGNIIKLNPPPPGADKTKEELTAEAKARDEAMDESMAKTKQLREGDPILAACTEDGRAVRSDRLGDAMGTSIATAAIGAVTGGDGVDAD